MRALKSLAVLSLIPLFAACGAVKVKGADDEKVGSQSVEPIDDLNLKFSEGVVSGTGSFKGSNSDYVVRASYSLSFQLTGRSGVSLVSHASASLNGGVEVELTRDASSNVLSAVFRSGDIAENKSFDFRNLNADDILSMDIEVNRGTGDYVGIRVTKLNANGTREVVTTGTLPASANYGNWGVRMTNATVFQSTRR